MDWNGDGKHDWQDDAFFHDVIDNDSNSSNTPSSRNYGSSSGGASFHLTQLGKVVIVLDLILCVAALFMGYANIIGDLLGFGVIGFLIAQWLDS